MPTIYEREARAQKVTKLALKLQELGWDSAAVRKMSDEDWRNAARLADCNPPHSQETKDAVAEALARNGEPESRVYTCETWQETIEAMHSGIKIEIDAEVFDYFLEVLPPVYMGRRVNLPGGSRRVSFGFAEGYEPITAFWTEGERHFCQRTTEVNRQ